MAMTMVLSWLLTWMEAEEDRMCKILPFLGGFARQRLHGTSLPFTRLLRIYHTGRQTQAGSQIPTRTRILEAAATGSVGTNYILADL